MSESLTLRFKCAMASMALTRDNGMIDLTEDDFNFLVQSRPWTMLERSRARRCVESTVYGSLDMVGLPRFGAPVEYLAGAIAYYVHPANIMSACAVFDGAEFTDNIINGVDEPIKSSQLFSLVIRCKAGDLSKVEDLYSYHQTMSVAQGVVDNGQS